MVRYFREGARWPNTSTWTRWLVYAVSSPSPFFLPKIIDAWVVQIRRARRRGKTAA
jgi:hypothetical protein